MNYLFPRMNVILISGRAGVGKTTMADFLSEAIVSKHPELIVVRSSFARPLKDIAIHMGWDKIKDKKGRKLLQELGAVGRNYDKDIWAIASLYNIYKENFSVYPNVVIYDDWRFPNEADFFMVREKTPIIKIRIHSPQREILLGTPEYDDISETSLSDIDYEYYDYIIENNTPTLDLYKEQIYILADYILANEMERVK